MDIFCIERMRVLKGECGRVVLKLRLPTMKNAHVADRFNALYSSLIGEYTAVGIALAQDSTGDGRFTVDYSLSLKNGKGNGKDRGVLVVRRIHKYIKNDGELESVIIDRFDLKYGAFIT